MRLGSLVRVGLLALMWGSTFLGISLALRSFTPVQMAFLRLALGSAFLAVFLARRRLRLPSGRSVWTSLAVVALLSNVIPYLLFGIAQQTIASSLAGAINATVPLWAVFFAFLARTETSLTSRRVSGLVLGLLGAVLILHPWDGGSGSLLSVLACLGASATYGAGYVYMGRLTNRGLPPLVLSAGQLLAGTGWLVLASPFGAFTPVTTLRPEAVVAVALMGFLGTGAAYVLSYRIVQDDGPIAASSVTYLLPAVAGILGAVVLDEALTLYLIAGTTAVLVGVILTRGTRDGRADPVPTVGP